MTLAIMIPTRNDDYGGNLLGRIQGFVDAIGEYSSLYGWNPEVIIVEWNPPGNRPFLEEVVKKCGVRLRILRVPKELHDCFENSDVLKIYGHIGRNVALRRTEADWILSTTQDVIFSDKLARFLANGNLDPHCFYRATRFDTSVADLPGGNVAERLAHLAANVENVRAMMKDHALHTRASGDFILMHRSVWHEIRGMPEWGLHDVYFDGIVLFAAYASGLRQVVLDQSHGIYHIKHGGGAVKRGSGGLPTMEYESTYKRLTHHMLRINEPLIVNDENWGLADCEDVRMGDVTWELRGEIKKRGQDIPT